MSKTLKTVGDLREFLANIALGVKDGTTKIEEARTIIKAVEKINENFYAESKVAQLRVELGEKAASLGKLEING